MVFTRLVICLDFANFIFRLKMNKSSRYLVFLSLTIFCAFIFALIFICRVKPTAYIIFNNCFFPFRFVAHLVGFYPIMFILCLILPCFVLLYMAKMNIFYVVHCSLSIILWFPLTILSINSRVPTKD